jgi:peroxiredoxin
MVNMSRFNKLFIGMAAMAAAVSCSNVANIDGVIEDAPSSEVIMKIQNVNKYSVLDTLFTDAHGKFSYKVELEEGQPEFVYVFKGDRKLASMLLEAGDKVSVKADTLGNYSVTGSSESEKLMQVEKDYAKAVSTMSSLVASLEGASAEQAAEITKKINTEYVAYYRSRIRYIMENCKSLTVVPVFYQTFGDNVPVFSQLTDAIHFSNISDSLATVYPESEYVKLLRKQADERRSQMELTARLQTADQIGFPDVTLPDMKGQKVSLSSVEAKVVLVQFWTASEAAQKMFNIDVLKPIYDDFHKSGLEIYQISLDVDKNLWAGVVKEQKLPWINVCDSRGAASPYALMYNLPGLPATFIISKGELVDGKVVDEKSLRQLLKKLL